MFVHLRLFDPFLSWLAAALLILSLVLACLALYLAWRLYVQTLATQKAVERLVRVDQELARIREDQRSS